MKINNTLVIVFLVLLLPFNLYPKKKDFKVFNALLFKDTPSLTEYGFSEINLIYEDGVISTNYKKRRAILVGGLLILIKLQRKQTNLKKLRKFLLFWMLNIGDICYMMQRPKKKLKRFIFN